MAEVRLEIVEYDDAGNITASYIESTAGTGESRVDVIVSPCSLSFVLSLLCYTNSCNCLASKGIKELRSKATRRLSSSRLSPFRDGRLYVVRASMHSRDFALDSQPVLCFLVRLMCFPWQISNLRTYYQAVDT